MSTNYTSKLLLISCTVSENNLQAQLASKIFFSLGLHLWHLEDPKLGAESEL